MVELFKVPIIRSKEDKDQLPHETLERVLTAAFPGVDLHPPTDTFHNRLEINDVRFDYVNDGGDWHRRFAGVLLKVERYSISSQVMRRDEVRRVMMKGGVIDLEAIRTKQIELAGLAKSYKEQSEKVNAAVGRRLAKADALSKELKLRKYFPISIGTEDVYSLRLEGLSAYDVEAVVALLRERGVADVKETEPDG